jgi:hypothetical protein
MNGVNVMEKLAAFLMNGKNAEPWRQAFAMM